MRFPAKTTASCIWVAIPVDWVILHGFACGAHGRSDVRSRDYQNFSDEYVTKFSDPWCSAAHARFSVLLFMLFMNIKRLSRATLKCDIVAKEDNYKYLVALYTQHLREQFNTFPFYFSLASLFLGIFRHEANKSFHSYSVNRQLISNPFLSIW